MALLGRRWGGRKYLLMPGKPQPTALVQSSSGRLREDCLSATLLASLNHARSGLGRWRGDHYHCYGPVERAG